MEGLAHTLSVAGFTIELWDVLTPPFFLLRLRPVDKSDTPVELLRLAVSELLSQVSL